MKQSHILRSYVNMNFGETPFSPLQLPLAASIWSKNDRYYNSLLMHCEARL